MRVIFRVDASLKIGTGHVMRCLTLAQVLKKNSVNVEFICRKHEGNLINKIRLSGFKVYELKLFKEGVVDNKLSHSSWLGVTQKQDASDCINILKSKKVNWLIVDHYALDEDWQHKVRLHYEKLMVIDDLADRKHVCDILLDQNFGRQQQDYEMLVPAPCELLLGSQYALLRPEFSKWREYSLNRRNKPNFKGLFINMGGVDIGNITGKVLNELAACTLPSDVRITVIMGSTAPNLEKVLAVADALPYKTQVKIDVDNMAEIMANTDMAIGAAGSTTWERCCLGLPTIQIATADNQNIIINPLTKVGAIKSFKSVSELSGIMNYPISWLQIRNFV
jgi:UDP-2,4-diacetamido-2,4,6-trideoxy-beta-L-altropyranose hydrolase